MANFEPFRWNIALSANLLFLKSGYLCDTSHIFPKVSNTFLSKTYLCKYQRYQIMVVGKKIRSLRLSSLLQKFCSFYSWISNESMNLICPTWCLNFLENLQTYLAKAHSYTIINLGYVDTIKTGVGSFLKFLIKFR